MSASTFREFDRYVLRIESSLLLLMRAHKTAMQSAFDHASAAALTTAAQRVSAHIDQSWPYPRPIDVLEIEWDDAPIAMMRARIDTLGTLLRGRPKDVPDWAREISLAADDFTREKIKFDRDIER